MFFFKISLLSVLLSAVSSLFPNNSILSNEMFLLETKTHFNQNLTISVNYQITKDPGLLVYIFDIDILFKELNMENNKTTNPYETKSFFFYMSTNKHNYTRGSFCEDINNNTLSINQCINIHELIFFNVFDFTRFISYSIQALDSAKRNSFDETERIYGDKKFSSFDPEVNVSFYNYIFKNEKLTYLSQIILIPEVKNPFLYLNIKSYKVLTEKDLISIPRDSHLHSRWRSKSVKFLK